jgi:hypothetical protein
MKKIILSIVFLFCLFSSLKAYDTSSIKYFPLSIGNTYVYHQTACCPPTSSYVRGRITKDTIINNKRYFYCLNIPTFTNGWYRTDSVTGSLFEFDNTNSCILFPYESLIDSLAADSANALWWCNTPLTNSQWTCTGTSNINLFGSQRIKKGFFYEDYYIYISTQSYSYVKYIGFFDNTWSYNHPPAGGSSTLVGCIVNGVLYGDTNTFTGIHAIGSEIPKSFALFQNYPNPFNPVTNIKFSLPEASFTKLIIYDELGREITTLVNEKQNAGTYEVDWDGSSYPSGVYFYKLIANEEIIETKKMILLK